MRWLANLSVWPVLHRELREGARRPVNHRLRLLSGGVGTLVLWAVASDTGRSVTEMGNWLLSCLHTWFLALVFVMVPALTADCVAREKREGTLGLLFLTPLSAGGIIAGKVLARVLRTFTLWLAVLPLLALSFLGGGVTWFDALSALSLEFCAAVLCLAAGLLASTLARERGTAFLLAFVLSALFWWLFTQLFLSALIVGWQGFARLQVWGLLRMTGEILPLLAGLNDLRGGAGWSALALTSPRLARVWMWLCGAGPLAVLGLCWLVAWLGAVAIERSWQDKVPSARRAHWLRRCCTPLFHRRFARWSQRCLDWNPIAWLQQYSWKARLSRLGLCLGFVGILYLARYFEPDTRADLMVVLLVILAGCYSFVGVSGFLEEKRSGALELLLVTPLSANRIIFGRTWGLWKQFLPAALVLAGFQLYGCWCEGWSMDVPLQVMLACGFLAMPVFATYFALRVKYLLVAAALTWAALFLPVIFAGEATNALWDGRLGFLSLLVVLANLGFAFLACWLLRHSLSRRIYSF